MRIAPAGRVLRAACRAPCCRPFLYVLSVLLVSALSPAPAAREALYLQGGEEYFGTLERIARGRLHAVIGGQARTFPLEQVHRIEFQRRRLLDDVTKASQLPRGIAFFREALGPETAELRRRFPEAAFVVLADETEVVIDAAGTWEAKRFEAWRILEERGAESAMRRLEYFPDRQQAEVIFGLTVLPDGRVQHLADTAMKDEALYPRLPAYNFQHRLRFTLKGAVPGATLLLATARRGRASLLEPFVLDEVFWRTEPVLRRSVRLAVEEGAADRVATATANGPKGWGEGGLWEIRDAPQLFPEPMMPPTGAFAPRLVIAFPKATWAEVAAAFRKRAGGDAALATKGVPPRALFDQVRQSTRLEHVPLDALPDGPARPDAVLVRGYGTEVERALLLAALLRGAGHRAETILVRSRDDGPLVAAAPRLRGFSKAVVRLATPGGKTIWLQADDEDRGFGELSPDVQGAEGLDLATGKLLTVPVRPVVQESKARTVEVTLAPDGSATARESLKLRGRYAADYRGLKDLTADQLRKWATRYVGSEVPGAELVDFSHSDFNNANAEERLSFVYRLPGLAQRAGDFLLLRLPNASVSATAVGRSSRERDLFWLGVEREETAFVVKAPPGYAAYAVGGKVLKKGEGWSLVAGFAADPSAKGTVRFRGVWQRSALAAPRSAYAAYREACIARSRLRRDVVVFVKE